MFAEGGPIATAMERYRVRPSQTAMAKAVEQCLSEEGVLLAEAGTGTGKTLAYLVPLIFSGKKAVVSTGTKNLQEQVFFKDIAFLEQVLGRSLNAVYLKGQDNYLCRRRYSEFMRSPAVLGYPAKKIEALRAWVGSTDTGDRMTLRELNDDDPLWWEVCSTKDTRIGARCALFNECFVTAARKQAMDADLVVVNHHLYFADAAMRGHGGALLPRHEAAVFDEAHGIEDIAVEFFSHSISSGQVERLVQDAMKTLRSAQLRSDPSVDGRERLADNVKKAAALFFENFNGEEGRVQFSPDEISSACVEDYYRLDAALDAFEHSVKGLEGRDEAVDHTVQRVVEIRDNLAALVTETATGFVGWLDRRRRSTILGRSPIDVSQILRERVFFTVPSVVLTSATLSTGGDFRFLKSRVGIDFDVREITVPSPFHYETQACLYVPDEIADPRDPRFVKQAADEAAALIELTHGGALVLCTSYRHMTAVYNLLSGRVPGELAMQGSAPKQHLLKQFAKQTDSTLVATAGFWQGVDLPGDVLRLVIMDKLPFSSPGDPLEAARIASLTAQGKRPFIDYQVPAAALLLKQGFGRLIRTEQDTGIVAVLDRRLTKMNYAEVFLRSLPPCPRFQNFEAVKNWWLRDRQHLK